MTLPAGDNKTRFEITFKNTGGTLTTPDEANNMFAVVQNNEQGMLTILNTYKKDIKSTRSALLNRRIKNLTQF